MVRPFVADRRCVCGHTYSRHRVTNWVSSVLADEPMPCRACRCDDYEPVPTATVVDREGRL